MKSFMLRVLIVLPLFTCLDSAHAGCPKSDQLLDSADAHFVERRYEKAIACYDEAIELTEGEIDDDARYNLAQCHFFTGEMSKASTLLLVLTKKNPKDHGAWNWLSRCYRQNGDFANAIRCLRRAEAAAGQNKANAKRKGYWLDLREDFIDLGLVLFDREDYHNAIRCADAAQKWHEKYSPGSEPFNPAVELYDICTEEIERAELLARPI